MVTHQARLCRLLPAVCLVILFGAAEAAAQGTTALFFQSQVGDYIGAGQTRTYTPADGTFTADRSGNAVNARLIAPSSSFRWDLYLAAPEGESLVPGVYNTARRSRFSAYNGLDFNGSGRGCNTVTGRFLVLEAEYGPGGTVVKFAADFEQHCDDADAALFGAIRFNSTIAALSPFGGAYPDYTLTLVPPVHGSITSDGALTCGTAGAACAQTLAGAAMAALTATPDSGYLFAGWTGDCRGVAVIAVHVNGPKSCGARFEPVVTTDPRTLFIFDSRPGDPTGGGKSQVYSPANGPIEAQLTSNPGVLTFTVASVDEERAVDWTITMTAARREPLLVGTYEGALTYAGQRPALQVGSCINAFGRFVIRELVVGSNNTVVRAAVDVEQHCGIPDAGFFAAIRYNSTITDPTPFGGNYPIYRLSLTPSTNGTVSGGGLNCGSAGGACDLNPSTPTSVMLTATPDPGYVFAGWTGGACIGGSTLTIRVNTIKGCSAVFEPLITSASRTLAFLDYMAEARGSATAAGSEAYSPASTDWTAMLWDRRTLDFTIYTLYPTGIPTSQRMTFSAPQGQVLTPGVSYAATRYPFATVTPGIDAGLSCNLITGRFVVRDLDVASTGEVRRAAVDFEAHCNDIDPAVYGTVRFNSALDARPFDGDYPRYRLVITGDAHGRVTGAGLNCGPEQASCQADFAAPTAVSLTAIPDSGYRFIGWTGTCHGGETIGFRVNTVLTCGPLFEPAASSGVRAVLRMVSQAGESIVQGRTEVYSLANSAWTTSASSLGAVTFTVSGRLDADETQWRLSFAAPPGERLLPGTYLNAGASANQPYMSVSGNGHGCGILNGSSFTVRQLELDSRGNLSKAAIDFEQHCTSVSSPALTGTIEYTAATDASRLTLDKTSLVFTSASDGNNIGTTTGPQTLRLSNAGTPVAWTASSSDGFLRVTPSSESGSATLTVSIVRGLAGVGVHTGTVTVSAGGNALAPVKVTWNLLPEGGSAPFGSFDTPVDGTTGVHGSVAVTGWALDDIEVAQVQLWRDPNPGDPPGAVFAGPAPQGGKVFIGNASLVEGARPDVEAGFVAPNVSRAGWGYMMLTRGMVWDGRGPFRLYAIAVDSEGHIAQIGSKTVSIDNSVADQPFGTLDAPGQGVAISGLYPNTGWVLTPNAGASIPAGGVQVVVDGVFLNQIPSMASRSDITSAFPQFDTSQAGRGLFIDTTALADGVHTIGWLVTDSAGKSDGVGSRFFRVANGPASTAAVRVDAAATALARAGIRARRGWDLNVPFEDVVQSDGAFPIEAHELDRIEIELHSDAAFSYDGYAMVLGERRPLPSGSTLDPRTGVFTWQPGPGFIATYDLVFTAIGGGGPITQWPVRIVLSPGSARAVPIWVR